VTSAPIKVASRAGVKNSLGKVAHLTSVHSAFDVRIFHKECRTLANAGYEVTLVAPHDRAEFVDGVQIQPVSMSTSRRSRMTGTAWEVYRKALASGADICHLHDPELLPVGVLLKLAGRRIIYDAHEDLCEDILIKNWIPLRIRGLVSASSGAIEQLATRVFDCVVSATPTIAKNFHPNKSVIVQNFPVVDELFYGSEAPYLSRQPLVAYVGSITKVRGVQQMVAAMQELPARLASRLLLAGGIQIPSLHQELRISPGWDRVDYLGFQERASVARLLGRARVGLVVLHPVPTFLLSYPTKLFEYMSVGIPVIASNFPTWRDVVERVGCGLVVDPLNVREIADSITWLLDHPAEAEAMGKRGQEAVCSTYNWSFQAQNLLGLYSRIFQNGTRVSLASIARLS
jgi:glycosyltransferase involved in cell wall biosynthesis